VQIKPHQVEKNERFRIQQSLSDAPFARMSGNGCLKNGHSASQKAHFSRFFDILADTPCQLQTAFHDSGEAQFGVEAACGRVPRRASIAVRRPEIHRRKRNLA
jgi:hypothetical protein